MTIRNAHHETLHEAEAQLPSDSSTGFVFAAVAAIVAIIFRDTVAIVAVAALLSIGFAGTALLAPRLLRPLNFAWFRFALLLNMVVSPIVMAVIYAVAIVPFGLALQMRRDPLTRRRNRRRETYWIVRPKASSSMHDQF